MSEIAKCGLCGEPMPPGEEVFKYHGFSGPCPKPHLPDPPLPADMAAVIRDPYETGRFVPGDDSDIPEDIRAHLLKAASDKSINVYWLHAIYRAGRRQNRLDMMEHVCAGCGHKWGGIAPVELCGDCWRKRSEWVSREDREKAR